MSPLALPALHLGSFSDLKLGEQFGISNAISTSGGRRVGGVGSGGGAVKDEEQLYITPNATMAPQSPSSPPILYTQQQQHRQNAPRSPAYMNPGVPFLRESPINRHRTMVFHDPVSSSYDYDTHQRSTQLPPRPDVDDSSYIGYKERAGMVHQSAARSPDAQNVNDVKDHPDYAGFPYTPAYGVASTFSPPPPPPPLLPIPVYQTRTSDYQDQSHVNGMTASRSLGALATFTSAYGNGNGNENGHAVTDAEAGQEEVDSGLGITVDDFRRKEDAPVVGRQRRGKGDDAATAATALVDADGFYPSQRYMNSANVPSPVTHPQHPQQHQPRASTLPQEYASSPAAAVNDFGTVVKQHQQSRSMGTTGSRNPRLRGGGEQSPEFSNIATPTMTGRPRTVFDFPPSFPRHASEPLSTSSPPARETTRTTPYQQTTSYNPVPTIPGLLASVRGGGATGQSGPYPLAARPRAVSDWTRNEQKDSVGQSGEEGRAQAAGNTARGKPDTMAGTDVVPTRVRIPPPQEEICMECLMRDRDLIHVKVIGDAVWSRASDVDFKELLERERALDALLHVGERSRRAVRWRGFSWEEQGEGEVLPDAFRARFEGELRESKLKELATRMIAPSAHRYKTLQKYLADQAQLFGIPPEEEAQLESSVWLRQHERYGSTSRVPSLARGMAHDARHGQPSSRLSGYEQHGTTNPLHWPDRSLSANARATMYDGTPRQARYASPNERQPFEYDNVARAKPRVPAIPLDMRKGRGISSPGLLEMSSQPARRVNSRPSPTARSYRQDQMYNYTDDDEESMILDLTDQDQPGSRSAPLRPFSFVVRAGKGSGNAGSTRSSPGPGDGKEGLSSVLGRWGGSVTSLFGGSQAGGSHWGGSNGGNSGSMMDMHLGLDLDRRRPNMTNAHPRATSMASLSRPRFFSRATSSYMSHQGPGDTGSMLTAVDTRVSEMPYERSQAGSRQAAAPTQPVVQEEKKKKKGFKGLLQKISGKKNKSFTETKPPVPRSGPTGPPLRDEDYSAPLAPPPPISFLVQRSDRAPNHTRTSSSSSLSAFSGSGSPPKASPVSMMMRIPGMNDAQSHPPASYQNQRSVSAPLVQSPSRGSLVDVAVGNGNGNGNSQLSYHREADAYSQDGPNRESTGPTLFTSWRWQKIQ
ncbi:hypothetical protein QFC21_004123 [Naganishia friedmannii]|uniref:Uncharacterized protein n=1 Tax=Naganishia friedmannii TaxID=89922 RepID=A0ACC2VJJ4_9TREE|nr:hypothetical protein QFC21_004123 [Naganishia friedmannii]